MTDVLYIGGKTITHFRTFSKNRFPQAENMWAFQYFQWEEERQLYMSVQTTTLRKIFLPCLYLYKNHFLLSFLIISLSEDGVDQNNKKILWKCLFWTYFIISLTKIPETCFYTFCVTKSPKMQKKSSVQSLVLLTPWFWDIR